LDRTVKQALVAKISEKIRILKGFQDSIKKISKTKTRKADVISFHIKSEKPETYKL